MLIIGALVSVLMGAVSASTQDLASDINLTAAEEVWIFENPIIKASNSKFYAPFDFMRAGLPSGLSIDYLNLVAQKVGLKIEYVKYDNFPNSVAGAINNEIDIIHSITKNTEREKQFLFSEPYFEETFANFGRTDSDRITSIDDLKKLRIGIVKSHMVGDVYKNKYSNFNLIEYDNYLDVKSGLLLGEVDVFTGDNSVVEFFLTQNNVQGLEKIGDDFVMDNITNDLHIAVQNNNQTLMGIIDKGMSAVTEEEFRKIAEKWIKSPATRYQIDLTPEEQAWIIDHPIVKVANNTLHPPFDFVIAGQPAGLSIDYLNLLARKIGLKIDYKNFKNFPSVLAGAINNEVDIIHSLSKNSRREELLLFSNAYMAVSVASFGRIGSEGISSIGDLEGKRIGVLNGNFITDAYRENYPDLNFTVHPNYREAILALANNEIDVLTGDVATIEYYMSLYNVQDIMIIGNGYALKGVPYFRHLAVQKNNQILMTLINKAIESVTTEEFDRISAKWVNDKNVLHNIGLSDDEIEWLANNKTVITAANFASTPYEFINEAGKIDGLTGEYLNEISKRLNIEFVWAGNESWNEGLEKIISQDADIVTGVTPTADRIEYLSFSEMFISYESAIYSRTESIHFANLESLRGYTVAQIKGTADVDYLREHYPDIKIIEVESIPDAVTLLSNGGVDAFTGDNIATSPIILNANIKNLIISGIAPYSFNNGIGTRKDLPLLASSIQKALSDISPERRQQILNKWTLLRFIPNTDYGYLWNVLAISLLILFFTLIWNGKLTVAREEALASKKEAEDANASKSKFLANISHELRTPLNSLLLLSQNLRKNNTKNLTAKQVKHVNVIHNSGTELLELIEDLLDYSKIDSNQMTMQLDKLDLQDMSEYILDVFEPQTDEVGLDFTLTIDEKLPRNFVTDKQRLYQIIKNLISNAIKFTAKGSISVCIKSQSSLDDHTDQIKISVSDTGIGIDAEAQNLIFKTFTQGDENISRKYGGTGLGLSISKELANLLGGDITVESNLGNGSTFNLLLPLQTEPDLDEFDECENFIIESKSTNKKENGDNSRHENLALKGKTMLLVDDDERNIFSLSEILKQYGIKSVIAKSGVKAIEELKKRSDIDLVLMDMMMPGMDGDDAISRIRFMAKYEHLPIISLTANSLPIDRQKCMDAGANDHLTKPIDIDILKSKMRTWLN